MNCAAAVKVFSIMLVFLVMGCSQTREPKRASNEFFKPVTAIPKRNHPAPGKVANTQPKKLKAPSAGEPVMARDSLSSLPRRVEVLTARSDSLAGRENKPKLDQDKILKNEETFQTKTSDRRRQFPDMSTQVSAGNKSTSPSYLKSEYADGLTFFKQRRYDDALQLFTRLVDKGVEEDMVDNCEYWIGECLFAKGENPDAVTHFEKVISLGTANKRADAYFMIGKIYEQAGDRKNARWYYNELIRQYPNHDRVRVAKSRLEKYLHP